MAFEINATSLCLIPFQASGFRLTNGTLIYSSNVTLYVYNNTTDVIPQYNETFTTGLQNGYISVTMGNTSSKPLNLDWGVTYWLALDINGTPVQMVDYGGIQTYRKAFISTQGEITALNTLNSSIFSIGNLTLTQIVANIGNWTLDKISYASTSWVTNYISAMSNLTLSQITNNIGNWTLDKPSYATQAYVNAISNLSYAQIVLNIGNYSADNLTIVRNGTKICSSGQVLQNITGNSSGIYGDCIVVSSSSGVQYNTSIGMYFNKTTTTYTGNLTNGSLVGYMAGHAICNATYLGTHFCSQEEVMETIWHTNVSTMTTWSGSAWVTSGAPKYAPATTPVNDCNGWTSAIAASYLGNYWTFSTAGGGVGATINCGTSIALACCGVG